MIELVIEARKKELGGFEVGRVLPYPKRRHIGPFVFLDHIGPAAFAPGEGIDVRPHPHIGLATLTYLFQGEMVHQDSTGAHQTIRPGEVNWMVAGRGVTHSERTDPQLRASGYNLHGIQAWVALPDGAEDIAPSFHHFSADSLPSYQKGGLNAKLVIGEAFAAKSDVPTHSPLFMVHWELTPGARCALTAEHPERAIYVAKGAVDIDRQRFETGQLIVFKKDALPEIMALLPSTLIAFGGSPVGERHIWWNFVSSSKAKIEAAAEDWRTGKFELPPHDRDSFIPLPADVRVE